MAYVRLLATGTFLFIAMLVCLPFGSFGASDPFNGSWKLNLTKSKLRPPFPVSQILQIEINGQNFKAAIERTDAGGKPSRLIVNATFGGNAFGILDSPEVDFVKIWRPDERTILAKWVKSSTTVRIDKFEVSRNTRTLKVTSEFTAADERPEATAMALFERQ